MPVKMSYMGICGASCPGLRIWGSERILEGSHLGLQASNFETCPHVASRLGFNTLGFRAYSALHRGTA